jgi:hypothetical protein
VPLTEDAREVAIAHIRSIDDSLAEPFAEIIDFLLIDPDYVVAASASVRPTGSQSHVKKMSEEFINGRKPRLPNPPKTIPDAVVELLLVERFEISTSDAPAAIEYHRLAMGAENAIGHMLEHYIDSVASKHGWVWCSGNVVKKIDFIKPEPHGSRKFEYLLQVKNRYNSENSSSKAIRDGTPIEKWCRTKSNGDWGWKNFPDPVVAQQLSEPGFRDHIHDYLAAALAKPTV